MNQLNSEVLMGELGQTLSSCRAVILDVDGTILDSLHVWDTIDERSFGRRNQLVPSDFAQRTATMNELQVAHFVIEHYGWSDDPEALVREWSDLAFDEYAHHINLRNGVIEYLQYLRERNITVCIATTLSSLLCRVALERTGVLPYCDVVYTAEDFIYIGKSDWQAYVNIANAHAIDVYECVVFEDSLQALRAAQQAHMRTVGVCDDVQAARKLDAYCSCDWLIQDFTQAPCL